MNRITNAFYKYFFKLIVLIKYGIWGDFHIHPSIKMKGVNHISLGVGTMIFDNSELNTSASPYAAPYKKRFAKGKIEIHKNVKIKDFVKLITYDGSIVIGENSSINPYSIIYGHGGVKIGKNVMIAAHTVIVSANHNFSEVEVPMNLQGMTSKGIIIEDNVWIGSGVKILDGVKIGTGSIIAAGSVVNRNIDEFTLAGGVPAKFLKKLN